MEDRTVIPSLVWAPTLYDQLGLDMDASLQEVLHAHNRVERSAFLVYDARWRDAARVAFDTLGDVKRRTDYDTSLRKSDPAMVWPAPVAAGSWYDESPVTCKEARWAMTGTWSLSPLATSRHIKSHVSSCHWKRLCDVLWRIIPAAAASPGYERSLQQCCKGLATICHSSAQAARGVVDQGQGLTSLLLIVLRFRQRPLVLREALLALAAICQDPYCRDVVAGQRSVLLALLNMLEKYKDDGNVIVSVLLCLAALGHSSSRESGNWLLALGAIAEVTMLLYSGAVKRDPVVAAATLKVLHLLLGHATPGACGSDIDETCKATEQIMQWHSQDPVAQNWAGQVQDRLGVLRSGPSGPIKLV